VTSLVNQEAVARANGMIQIAMGVQQIVSPLLGGFLLTLIKLRGIILVELATLAIAIIPLLIFRFSQINQPSDEDTKSRSFLQEMTVGWIYLKERSGLLGLMILYSVYQFLVGFVFVLCYPMVLSLTTPSGLGVITFLGGIGMLVGATVMSIWGNRWQKLIGPVFTAMSLSGLWIVLAGLRPDTLEIGIATLLFFLGSPFINGLTQVILQKKVVLKVQGRVFALTGAISGTALPLAAIIAAPLADNIFEPLMAFDGPWSKKLIGQIIGSGPGRGIGLLFVIMGCLTLMVTLIGYQYRPIRELEDNLPAG
ncbi:MAG: MFS transporter, partial [Cyanobacteria bacterium J06635_10]